MRKIHILIFLILLNVEMYAQKSDTFNSMEYNENVSTQNNSTQINLFDIDFNGNKIPITLLYNHNGNVVNELPNSLGIGWSISDIGIIRRIINDKPDDQPSLGWFNSVDINGNLSSNSELYNCILISSYHGIIDCPIVSSSFNGIDLSPDFFSMNTSNGINFDFIYKKNISSNQSGSDINQPIPIILSNYKDYLIDTNFNHFPTSENNYFVDIPNNNLNYSPDVYYNNVFNITDTNGNVYDFINGPLKQDINRSSSGSFRNDYYLNSIRNPSKSDDLLNINYRTTNLSKIEFFGSGHNFCPSLNCSNDIIENVSQDYFFTSENRYDISSITSKNSNIEFVYSTENYLTEIKIYDNFNNYISGFLFTYTNDQHDRNFLYKIEKYDNERLNLELLYTFEYFDTPIGYNLELNSSVNRINRDFFGYFNSNISGSNMFPFTVMSNASNGQTIEAGDFSPNLSYAKYYSLKKIINKYSGGTEFEYKLKTDLCYSCNNSIIYGGGLVLDSKTILPNTGKNIYIKYNYENLIGNVLDFSSLKYHYARSLDNDFIAWSTKIELINTESYTLAPQEFQEIEYKKMGSFYKKITESIFELENMTLLSKTIKEYISNVEGVFFTPRLTKELFFNSSNNLVKEVSYDYNTIFIESIGGYKYRSEIRNLYPFSLQIKKLSFLTTSPISVNRVNLTEKKEKIYTPSGEITKTLTFNYVNPYSNLVRSKIEFNSMENSKEERYYYPTDSEVASEPFINLLLSNNRISSPLKIETYYGSEKISENKTVFSIDLSTSNLLMPKRVFSKKGSDNNSILNQKLIYDLYDERGNVKQYTKENGISVIMIWGYDKTKLIAKIENASYSSLSTNAINLIIAAQNASNLTDNELNLLNALSTLRADTAFSNSMITTYTYNIHVGVSSVTDSKGEKLSYSYDKFGKLINIKDNNGNIITESEYNYKPQY